MWPVDPPDQRKILNLFQLILEGKKKNGIEYIADMSKTAKQFESN